VLDFLLFLYNIPVFILTAVHESGHAGAEILYSPAGYLAEGALLSWLWRLVPPLVDGTNAAYALFVLFWFSTTSFICALTADRGSDLHFVLGDLRKLARRIAR
jgi:hypothetical protein